MSNCGPAPGSSPPQPTAPLQPRHRGLAALRQVNSCCEMDKRSHSDRQTALPARPQAHLLRLPGASHLHNGRQAEATEPASPQRRRGHRARRHGHTTAVCGLHNTRPRWLSLPPSHAPLEQRDSKDLAVVTGPALGVGNNKQKAGPPPDRVDPWTGDGDRPRHTSSREHHAAGGFHPQSSG